MDLEQPLKPSLSDQDVQDAQDLAMLGHSQALTRKFDMWSMLSLTFCVLGMHLFMICLIHSWLIQSPGTYYVFAQDLSEGLTNGGSISILWGMIVVTACNICIALSLGELTSSMPTALGQAYWVYRLWKTPTGRFVSYMCAWINTFGWWTAAASLNAFLAEFLLEIKTMFDPTWEPTGWVNFMVYVGVTFLLTAINVVGCRKEQVLPWLNNFVAIWYIGMFVVLSLALLISVGIKSDLSFQSPAFVFGKWNNNTGWSDGVVWFTGMVQAAYGLTAFDSVIHMVEEIPAPRQNVPRIIWMAVLFGAVTGFIFMIVCLFCIQDLGNLLRAPLPFIDLVRETVGLEGGATLIALFTFNGIGQGVSVVTTSSRLTWGFARDGGLPRYLSYVDPVWKAPIRALWAQGILISLVGVLYLFSDTVLQAILSVSTIALNISYAIPIVTLLFTGRDQMPPSLYDLGRWGLALNWISIIYCIITTVFFLFPYTPNPTPSDMNYAIAVLGVMLIASVTFWVIKGSQTYLQTEDAMAQILQAQQLELTEELPRERQDGKKR
ncbi:hypothetical protein N7474_010641 [Penicillium riverlandense]|uniref:uncharacterized protein n=1 Tax=Penicillium riverlandense TaxID=1903569 RepID=UPI002547583F|nr:uncharacterized protein N7474_010641 [Penicillium riverlandense]KAJ5807049.1 hypothetical protein N7474_010641 [Penicillium riverlandense]